MRYEYRKLTPEQRSELVDERLSHGYPPHLPPHPVQDQPYYLLTATCYDHIAHMRTPERRQELLGAVFEWFGAYRVEILGWVFNINHYHMLARVVEFKTLRPAYRRIHGPLARKWSLEDCALGRQVWYSFADRAIRSEAHYYTSLNYIHYNPVKHGYVGSPYAWAESSVHWYLRHYGREWLRDLWVRYPIREYGRGWDEGERG